MTGRQIPGWAPGASARFNAELRRLADAGADAADPGRLSREAVVLADEADPDRLRRDAVALAQDARYGSELAALVRDAGAPFDLDAVDEEPRARDAAEEAELSTFAQQTCEDIAEARFQASAPSPHDRLLVRVGAFGPVTTRISPATAARRRRERLAREAARREALTAAASPVRPRRGVVVRPGVGVFFRGSRLRGAHVTPDGDVVLAR